MTFKQHIKITSFLITVMLSAGCEPEPLEIDIPVSKPELVVTPFYDNRHGTGILLTRTFSPLSDPMSDPVKAYQQLRIEGAAVYMIRGTDTVRLEDSNPFFHSRDLDPSPGEMYRLRITDRNGIMLATSETEMFQKPDTAFMQVHTLKEAGDTTLRVRIGFNKDAGRERYFLLTFSGGIKDLRDMRKNNQGMKSLYDHPELIVLSPGSTGPVERSFSGREYRFRTTDTLTVSLSEISRGYHEYLKVYKKTQSLAYRLIGEPVNFPGNIRGGRGYFFLNNPVRKKYHPGW